MIVVSDTTPLNYLFLIEVIPILPSLFGQVFAPPAVILELSQDSRNRVKERLASDPIS
jgi:predicted nucleic acid-binding protein